MEVGLMRLESFSQQLRRGLDDLDYSTESALEVGWALEPALAGLSLRDLRGKVRDPELPPQAQDRLWAAILRGYRQGPPESWGPLVLELLAPALIELAAGFAPQSPTLDADDLQQQIALEALAAARSIPLERGRFVKPWLVLEVRRRISRWLRREARRRRSLDLDEEAPVVAVDGGAAWELCELRVSNQRSEDLALVYRLEVLGESLEEVGLEMGCTANAVECLGRRARLRLKRELLGFSSEERERTAKDRRKDSRPDGFRLLAG